MIEDDFNFIEHKEAVNLETCKKTIMNIDYFFMNTITTIRLLICVGDIYINIGKKEKAKIFYKSAVEFFLKEPSDMQWFLKEFENIIKLEAVYY